MPIVRAAVDGSKLSVPVPVIVPVKETSAAVIVAADAPNVTAAPASS